MKFKLFVAEEDWDAKEAELRTAFNIPNPTTSAFAPKTQVGNPDNDDYEKYIYPVPSEPARDARPYFNANELVDYDETWQLPDDEE